MKPKTVTQKLLGLLDGCIGQHQKIARETGISQATMSRIYLRKVSPSVANADLIFAWFAANAKPSRKKSTLQVLPTSSVRPKRASPAAASAVTQ